MFTVSFGSTWVEVETGTEISIRDWRDLSASYD